MAGQLQSAGSERGEKSSPAPAFGDLERAEALGIIHDPRRYIEFEFCARLGIPSIVAVAHDLSDRLPTLRKSRAFKIWIGSEVASVMRRMGYEMVRPRGRASWGNYFTYGTVWGKSPGD